MDKSALQARDIYQIPRNTLVWMLASCVLVVAPHASHLPGWILFSSFLALLWRIQVFRGVWAYPNRWVKTLLVLMSVTGLVVGYGRLLGLEPMVALLVIAFSLKLLEMYKRQDALLVIYLAYFVAASLVLFNQSMLMALYILLTFVVITTGLMGLNQSAGHRYPLRSLKRSSSLVLQALPIMLVLFLVMPRLGALWSVPSPQSQAKTGISDSMSPGSINRLAQSGELAFRASFQGEVPANSALYWRGLVFSHFDGRTWSQGPKKSLFNSAAYWRGNKQPDWLNRLQISDKAASSEARSISYEIIQEPTRQPWLYALATPESRTASVGLSRYFYLLRDRPLHSKFQYQVTSYLDYSIDKQGLSSWQYQQETRLPEGYNPQIVDLAKRWRAQAATEQVFIQRVMDWYHDEFTYTLQPPLLGKHSVDEFMLTTQRGFCEHFASSFVVMMRAAGIPARVVTGYQGGEVNPLQNYLMVYQYDAHAWTEVWLEGQGWVRMDPTAAVAPQRIERSAGELYQDQQGFLSDSAMSLVRFSNIALLNQLRLRLDMLDYAWHRWVLSYDDELQTNIFNRFLGGTDPLRVALLLFSVCSLVLGVIALRLFLASRPEPKGEAYRYYAIFCRKLKNKGLVRAKGESASSFAQRVASQHPELSSQARQISQYFEMLIYTKQDDESRRQLLRSLRQKASAFPGR